jgi:hypothetical protein
MNNNDTSVEDVFVLIAFFVLSPIALPCLYVNYHIKQLWKNACKKEE